MLFFEYNPLKDKTPKNAAHLNEQISIKCKILKSYSKNAAVTLYVRDDNGNMALEKNMNLFKEDNKYSYYEINFSFDCIGIYFYHFILKNDFVDTKLGHNKYRVTDHNFSEWQLTVCKKDYKTPSKFKGCVMYQIFPDRFYRDVDYIPKLSKNENERIKRYDWGGIPNSSLDTPNYSAKDFFLGNLSGIEKKLDYLKSLNISLLYLNPIFESAENHRYSTADYFTIDGYLGDNNIFKNFVKNFKENNIGIILDGVFSHTGSDSIYFNKNKHYNSIGAYNSIDSKYFDWYNFYSYPDKYESWWGFSNLPTINKNNEEFSKFINSENGVINYWNSLGISGWRLDVVDELPKKFVEELRIAVKRNDNDNLIIGEVWENASNKISYGTRRQYLLGNQLDSVMNYPWRNAIINFVNTKNVHEFKYQIENIIDTYPKETLDCVMNFLSTHDTVRAILELAIDIKSFPNHKKRDFVLDESEYKIAKSKFKIASFIQFTLPGIPCIYYGDEIGMYGFADPFNRKCFEWDKIDYELLNFFIELTKMRENYKKDFTDDFNFIFAENHCIIYSIGKLIAIINLNDENIYFKDINTNLNYYEKIFGSGEIEITKLGTIVSGNSYMLIERK